jgi:nucleotide-binding universal stress UspA family protein
MTKAEERLKKLTTHYPNKDAEDLLKFNVHIEYKVKEGLIIPSILETAKEINADLILLGSKSRAQISNIILGSAATEFITKTEQPVLLVPENYTFEKIENIAFATELKGNDSKAAIYLQELGQHLNAEIQPFFINQLPRDFFRDKEDQWLSDNLPLSGKAGTPVTVIREQGVVKGIDYYLEKHPAQILAMFTPKRKFLEKLFHVSATQRMVSKSNIPLLIYREK